MSAIPYMPLYISDYLADASHLTTVEHGAYLLLIMNYWQRGKALPSQSERLANVVRMSCEEFEKIRPTLAEFFQDDGQTWTHKRIEQELAHFRNKSEKARASAMRRHSERNANALPTHSETDANAERTQCYTDTDIYINNSLLRAWEIYPATSKGSKSKATEKFKALAKADPPVCEKILTAIQNQTAERILKTRYGIWCPEWKHFVTWLNQRCWENEVNLNEEYWRNEATQRRIAKPASGAYGSTRKSKSDLHYEACAGSLDFAQFEESRELKVINPES